ncbi:hypothetical protein TeGR_g4698, partial [Tetraparma gracilis]
MPPPVAFTPLASLPPSASASSSSPPAASSPGGKKYANPSYDSASPLSCCANLANTILGSGVLGLPHAFASTGSLAGLLLLTTAASFSAVGLHLLSACALSSPSPISRSSPSSFYAVARRAYPPATMVIDAVVAFKCFGVSTSYLTIIGDCMTEVMEFLLPEGSESVTLHRQFWVPFAVCAASSLCFFRSLDALKFTSTLSCFFVLFLAAVIFLYFLDLPGLDPCEGGKECEGPTELGTTPSQ